MDPLAGEKYLSLATFRKTGKAVETPVWFARSDDRYYVFTAGGSGKVKRLRNSQRARVAPCDVRGRVHGEWRQARACIVDDPALIRRAHHALRRKYGWQMAIADLMARLSGRLQRRAWLQIRLEGSKGVPNPGID